MTTPFLAETCPSSAHSSIHTTSVTLANGPGLNALKHGRYAESALLPGEDSAAFLRARRALFHTYRPQTKDEADLVDAMAKHRWIADRLGPVQAIFDAQIVAPERDAAGRVCEPIAHQREHSGIDVSARWKRVESMWHWARSKLLLTQRQRQQGLVAGAANLPTDCYMETDGTVYGPIVQRQIEPISEPEIVDSSDSASASADRADGFFEKQQKKGGTDRAAHGSVPWLEAPCPVHWLPSEGPPGPVPPGAGWESTAVRHAAVSSC